MGNSHLPLVIVFAKAPVAARVKTRLIPRLTAEGACRLHRAFVQDTFLALAELAGSCDVELHTDGYLADWPPAAITKRLQSAGDLGRRMLTGLGGALEQGRPTAMILGSDSPTLPAGHIESVLRSTADVCLGPSSDGGFYAISCRRIDANMFAGVEWSTGLTRAQALQSVTRASLTVDEGREWYDVDTSDDLDRLIADPNLRPFTRRALLAEGLIAGTGSD